MTTQPSPSAAPRPVENVYLDDATTHRCPPEGSGVMPCCNRTPFEVPSTDRITDDPERVTCDV